jgi:hypothetical protein
MREVEEVGVDRDKRTVALVIASLVSEPNDNVIRLYTGFIRGA